MKGSLSISGDALIPPWLNLNVLVFIETYKGHLWIGLCVVGCLCGWDRTDNID